MECREKIEGTESMKHEIVELRTKLSDVVKQNSILYAKLYKQKHNPGGEEDGRTKER